MSKKKKKQKVDQTEFQPENLEESLFESQNSLSQNFHDSAMEGFENILERLDCKCPGQCQDCPECHCPKCNCTCSWEEFSLHKAFNISELKEYKRSLR